jgi:hypothetical protein
LEIILIEHDGHEHQKTLKKLQEVAKRHGKFAGMTKAQILKQLRKTRGEIWEEEYADKLRKARSFTQP